MTFEDKGFILLRSIFSDKEIKELAKLHDRNFPSFSSGTKDFGELVRNNKMYNYEYFDKTLNIRFDGCPLKHRLNRGRGSLKLSDTPNLLYGKRASKRFSILPSKYDAYIFNKEILNHVRKYLRKDHIYFMLASANRVYPKYHGDSNIFHIDTYGFTYKKNCEFQNDFHITAIIYINGTSEGRSGTKIIPNSYKLYKDINKRVAKALISRSDLNTIHQREVYQELLTNTELNQAIQIEANPGDVVLFRSDLFHSINQNNSYTKSRDVVIASFSANKDFYKRFDRNEANHILKRVNKISNITFNYRLKNNTFKKNLKKIFVNKDRFTNLLNRIYLVFIKRNFSKLINIFFNRKKQLIIGEISKEEFSFDFSNFFIKKSSFEKFSKQIKFNNHYKYWDIDKLKKLVENKQRFNNIYIFNTLEYIPETRALSLLNQCYKLLTQKGVLKIYLPNIKLLLEKYHKKDLSFFNEVRNTSVYRYDSWLRLIVRHFAELAVDHFSDEELIYLYNKLSHEKFIDFFNQENQKISSADSLTYIFRGAYLYEDLKNKLLNLGFKEVESEVDSDQIYLLIRAKI